MQTVPASSHASQAHRFLLRSSFQEQFLKDRSFLLPLCFLLPHPLYAESVF